MAAQRAAARGIPRLTDPTPDAASGADPPMEITCDARILSRDEGAQGADGSRGEGSQLAGRPLRRPWDTLHVGTITR